MSFSGSGSGFYAIAQTTNGINPVGFQVGTFTSSDAVSAFFSDVIYLGGSWCYLAESTSSGFGCSNNADYPFVYHLDMGWEYCFDASNTNHGAFFYDFTDSAFFYTEPSLFPSIYDFKANAWALVCGAGWDDGPIHFESALVFQLLDPAADQFSLKFHFHPRFSRTEGCVIFRSRLTSVPRNDYRLNINCWVTPQV